MGKLTEIKIALGKILFNFSEIKQEDTVYVFENFEVDSEVYVFDANGDKQPAEDATFEFENKTVSIKDGKFSEIVEKEEEPSEDEPKDEPKEDEVPSEVEALENRVTELEERFSQMESQMTEVMSILSDTVGMVEEFAKTDVGEKIEKEEKTKENFQNQKSKVGENFKIK